MELCMTVDAILLALVIFGLRIINSAVGTMRLVVVTRDRRILASIMAFFEALIFAVVIANVVTDLSNILNLVAYCGGFAVGSYVGMWIESRFVTSYVTANIIVGLEGHDIAHAIRELGHGVTEMKGEGRAGEVIMLNSVIKRRDVPEVLKAIYNINPKAFVTLEEARSVQHGWLRPLIRNAPR
jgi:uncharacterized protein YebE (UPF0316 family)